MMTRIVLFLLRLSAVLPLSWLRLLGAMLGWVLCHAIGSRRQVVQTNLALCFPDLTEAQREVLTRQVFVRFAQAWLDRAWLWHGKPEQVRSRLKLTGELNDLTGDVPTVIFAPHFVGLDAGWTALTQQLPRHFTTIYTDQSNKVSDAWILQGRKRFGSAQLFSRVDGVKTIVASLRQGDPLYLLPDMNFGVHESLFVPFYGVPAATVPSLARFTRLGRAKVVPVVTRMTPQGYEVQVLPAWERFPTEDLEADTLHMNQQLETYINAMPEQYYWVHKRFKDRPAGLPDVYEK
jgi:KDO2-lipid IV(A) lauroyltransferase